MAIWERYFEFGDSTNISGVTEVGDGLLVSGHFAYHTDAPASASPWSPQQGFICKVPFVGDELTWLTRLNRFVPFSHACATDRIFLAGVGLAPATVEKPERDCAAFLEVEAQTGHAMGEASFITAPSEPTVRWSLGDFSHSIVAANAYFAAGTAYGGPTRTGERWELQLPYLVRVVASHESTMVNVLGERRHYLFGAPRALCPASDGSLLMVVSERQGMGRTDHFVRRIGAPHLLTQFLPVVTWEMELRNASSVTSVCETGDGGFVVAGSIERSRRWAGSPVMDNSGCVWKFDAAGNQMWELDLSLHLPCPSDPAIGRNSLVHSTMWLGSGRLAIYGAAPTGGMFMAQFLETGVADAPPERVWLLTLPRLALGLGNRAIAAANGAAYYFHGLVDSTPTGHRTYLGRLGPTGEPE